MKIKRGDFFWNKDYGLIEVTSVRRSIDWIEFKVVFASYWLGINRSSFEKYMEPVFIDSKKKRKRIKKREWIGRKYLDDLCGMIIERQSGMRWDPEEMEVIPNYEIVAIFSEN